MFPFVKFGGCILALNPIVMDELGLKQGQVVDQEMFFLAMQASTAVIDMQVDLDRGFGWFRSEPVDE